MLSFTNYIPVQQSVFIYQAAEVDLTGPGGEGSGGLTYFFVNARVAPVKRADIQATYHRGRSIDARSITDDLLNGRPVPAKTLDGFLYESIGARLTVEVARGFRVFAGYGQDKNDRDADPMDRLSFGVYTSNLLGTGIDVNVTDHRYQRGSASSYDSWYVSAGRSFGSRFYLSGEYTTSLSVLRYAREDGFVVESRPQTDRFGASANIYLSRTFSLLVVADYTRDEGYKENAPAVRTLRPLLTLQRGQAPSTDRMVPDPIQRRRRAPSRMRIAPVAPSSVRRTAGLRMCSAAAPTASPHAPCHTTLIATCVAPSRKARAR